MLYAVIYTKIPTETLVSNTLLLKRLHKHRFSLWINELPKGKRYIHELLT